MALACDIRIAVPNARFFYPVASWAFCRKPSDPGRLVALMGPARAKLLLMGGQKFTADEAYAFGLIDRITLPEHLLETGRACRRGCALRQAGRFAADQGDVRRALGASAFSSRAERRGVLEWKSGGALGHPGEESREPRMGAQRLDRVVAAGQFRLGQGRVDLVVADLVQQHGRPALAAPELGVR